MTCFLSRFSRKYVQFCNCAIVWLRDVARLLS